VPFGAVGGRHDQDRAAAGAQSRGLTARTGDIRRAGPWKRGDTPDLGDR
jgi:hypothetical protein